MSEKALKTIDDLTPDADNFNRHTEFGQKLLEDSLRKFGAGRSVLVDKDGNIIAGNGVVETAASIGMDKIKVVETDGTELVVVKRKDLTLDSPEGREMALADNMTALKGIDIDLDKVQEMLGDDMAKAWGMELPKMENEDEEIKRKEAEFKARMEAGEDLSEDEEYLEFLDKFKAKKTTDDCYTPAIVYDAVAKWVENEYKVNRKDFVRPFYPGGDYQKEKYPKGCIVVDNPPFSILAEITRFYKQAGVRFFLFAPRISNLSVSNSQGFTNLCVGAGITYENGAIVPTSFITNLEGEYVARSCPSLYKAVTEANEKVQSALHREIPKYAYPDHVVTAAMLSKYSKYDVAYGVKFTEYQFIGELDAQKEAGKAIYAGGLLVCDSAAAEKAAAEKAAAEKAAATRWTLSDRERAIIAQLSKNDSNGN